MYGQNSGSLAVSINLKLRTKIYELSFILNLVHLFRFPWEWNTPMGYFAVICVQFVWLHSSALMVICTLSIFVKCFVLLGAIALDIRENLNQFNYSSEELPQTRQKLVEIIELHACATRFINNHIQKKSTVHCLSHNRIYLLDLLIVFRIYSDPQWRFTLEFWWSSFVPICWVWMR